MRAQVKACVIVELALALLFGLVWFSGIHLTPDAKAIGSAVIMTVGLAILLFLIVPSSQPDEDTSTRRRAG